MKKRNDIDSIVKKVALEQDYSIIKIPKNTKDKVVFLTKNGDEIEQNFYNFINKLDYLKLSHKNIGKKERTPKSQILKFFENFKDIELYNFDYDKFINQQSKFQIRCKKCNKIFERSFSNLNKNQRCPYCSRLKTRSYGKTTDQFKNDVEKVFNGEYSVLGEYIDARTKIKLKHNICGTEFEAPAGRFLRENGFKCPECTNYRSKGEIQISEILSKNKVYFKEQQKFDNLVLEKNLVTDFYLPDFNLVIEFDGEHHFTEIEYFSNFTNQEKVKESDILKEKYFKEHNIHLLRIPYWEYPNLATILNKIILNKNNLYENTTTIDILIQELEDEKIFISRKYYQLYKNKNIYKKRKKNS